MALSLSHPEKQMVVVFPCIGTTASQITQGVCVEKSALLRFQALQESARIWVTLYAEGEKIPYLLLFGPCERRRGSAAILPLGCTNKDIASAQVLKETACFSTSFGHKFLRIWLKPGF